ncbi:G-type lectin S-receptor-like serine/threonine-protein kinase At4g03230 [Linum perenne]
MILSNSVNPQFNYLSCRIQFFQRPDDTEPFWVKPHDICDLTSPCGSFGSCNSGYRWPCKCLPGFVPKFENKWYAGDFSGGCTSTNCEDDSSFLNLTVAKVQKQTSAPSKIVEEEKCKEWCMVKCSCQAYSFSDVTKSDVAGCKIWDDLRGIEEFGRKDEENLVLRMYDSEKRVKEFINSEQFDEDDKRDINVPFFDLDCILAATDYFSIDNKLGQGGFGPVYKGKFPGGQEIAVKRLSSASAQGLEEFKNEVILIAKLQHKNLVRLLGYCVEGNEKILLYEYMPNKSLDFFIFDRDRCMLLDWGMRFNIIIMGIARGLLYLHHDSRLTIIHRDLKTSNILLDEEMNPRISDFGMARIMGGKETEANTVKVVGTYGYMSPEYALDGNFSIKSDVFSFGVVLLEILSGQRNTGFYKSNKVVSLLGHVWGCWKEEKAMEVMDQSLTETCVANEFMRCVNVALLCVQEDPNDRPTMANVVFMLGSEAASLSRPKEPAFSNRRQNSSTTGSSSIVSMETTTVLEAR